MTLLTTGETVSESDDTAPDLQQQVPSDGHDASDTSLSLTRMGIRDGTWLDGEVFPPLRYVVPGIMPEGFGLLVGPPKAGKSWLILNVLLAVASGGDALGGIAVGRPRPVLYLALEDGDRRMQSRARNLLDGRPIPERFHYVTAVPAEGAAALISAFLQVYPDTALVVIDTLGKIMPQSGPGESAYQRDYRIGGALKRVADDHEGLGLYVLHHDRKAGADDFVDAVSGTHGLAGAADTVIVLSRSRQSTDGSLKVTGRDVTENGYALTINGEGQWRIDGDSLHDSASRLREREVQERQARLSETSVAVLDFVRDRKGDVDVKTIREQFGSNADQYVKRAVDRGELIRTRRGHVKAVSEPSEVSDSQVTALFGASATLLEVSETPEDDQ